MADRPPFDDRLLRYLEELSAHPASPGLRSRLVAVSSIQRPRRFLPLTLSLGTAAAAVAALAVALIVSHHGGRSPAPVVVPATVAPSATAPQPSNSPVPSPSSSAAPSPSSSPVPLATTRILVATAVHANSRDVLVLRPDGSRVATITVTSAGPFTSVATRTDYLDASGHLWSIDANGRQTDRGSLGANTMPHIAVSPDGTRWAWSSQTPAQATAGRTTVHVGGPGIATSTVDQAGQPYSVWMPIAWHNAGILLAEAHVGIGGCCYLSPEYGRFEGRLLDPATLHARDLIAGCQAADLSVDGAYACASTGQGTGPVIVRTDGTKVPIQVPAAQGGAGWVSFTPDGRSVAVGVIVTRGQGGSVGPYDVRTYVANATTGATRLVGQHLVPDGWLADGRLVVSDAPAVLTGAPQPTVSLVEANGRLSAVARGDFFAVIP